tara:strand:+ start:43 stop:246 length:204 start_codon:yes stop_codon:yes gene_type:complete
MDRELEHRFMDETNEGAREDFAGLETHKIEYVCWLEYQILKPKEDTPIDCIQKAINHLEFELDKLKG